MCPAPQSCEQQSLDTTQLAPSAAQRLVPRQSPLAHVPEQQSEDRLHVAAMDLQLGWQTRPAPPSAQMREQHSSGVAHAAPGASQAVAARMLTHRLTRPVPVG